MQAEETGMAIGHFNVADLVLLKAVFAAAREVKVPVLVGRVRGGARVFRYASARGPGEELA